MSQARTAYEVLSQPSERAKYDGRYANVRASWFRYRKWTEWERGEEMAGAGGDSTPGNELTGYSRKLMDSIKERRARPSTVFVSGSPRSGGREEASDATEESEEDHSPQAWAARNQSRRTRGLVGREKAMRIRTRRSISVPWSATTGTAGGQSWKFSSPPPASAASCLRPVSIARLATRRSA
ncbi:hypothetical protein LX36DRAFT_645758 [Colletotrichum falcatum]|nr:hypothetical protein LX36DRAFT_645758 [Colletotrichum falcatum]